MNCLGLDLSFTNTGFCYGDAEQAPTFGSFPLTGAEQGDREAHLMGWLNARCIEQEFDFCGYEAAFQGKNPTTNAMLFGVAAITRAVCSLRGVESDKVHVDKWRQWVLGKGSGAAMYCKKKRRQLTGGEIAKEKAVRFCHAQGWSVANHDEAEACGVWLYTHLTRGNQRAARKILANGPAIIR